MSEENLTTPETVPEASDVSAAEGNGAEATVPLAKLSEVLGKDFKDPDTALKSVKDTFNYVGSQAQFREAMQNATERLGTDEQGVLSALQALAGQKAPEQPAPQTPTGDYVPRSQYEQDQFFATNPELRDLRDVLVPLKQGQEGMSWNEFIKQPHVDLVVNQHKAYTENQQKRSVVESNPRIAQMTDGLQRAQQALQQSRQAARTGDISTAEQANEQARTAAVNAVIEGLIK